MPCEASLTLHMRKKVRLWRGVQRRGEANEPGPPMKILQDASTIQSHDAIKIAARQFRN